MLTHKGTVPLSTERLKLRRMTMNDVEELFSDYATDDKMTKYLRWDTYTDIEKLREYVAGCVADYEDPACYHWVITMEDKIVGTINLHFIADKQERCDTNLKI